MGNVKTENNKHQAVLKYPGSKWRLASWIIRHFPPGYNNYVEPFFGSGAVLFNKPRSRNELINDIDDNIVNLFQVVRDYPIELAAAIEMTPYSQKEFKNCADGQHGDQVEKARRYLVRAWQSFGAKVDSKTWGETREGEVFRPKYWCGVPDRIITVAQRLKGVHVKNDNAFDIISENNYHDTLLYLDPPYLSMTRCSTHYRNELGSVEDHYNLLQLAKKHKGYVIISSYKNDLYDQELKGWGIEQVNVSTNAGGKRVEAIYISPNCCQQNTLF